MINPPIESKNIFTDVKYFILNKPKIDTLVKIKTEEERELFNNRIVQRTGQETKDFNLLNIHKISVNVPVKNIFEEILKWKWSSSCWPSHIAKFVNNKTNKHEFDVYLFRPLKLKNRLLGFRLFNLRLIKIQNYNYFHEYDNARYLVYKCSGGYPIGLFTVYVRSSIDDMNEVGISQLFFVVGFNFFGKKSLSKNKILRNIWGVLHNRVTSNIVNHFKQLCESEFEKFTENQIKIKEPISG